VGQMVDRYSERRDGPAKGSCRARTKGGDRESGVAVWRRNYPMTTDRVLLRALTC
jgi:hypothetical protein